MSKQHELDSFLNCFNFIDTEQQITIAHPIFLHLGYTLEQAKNVLSKPMIKQLINHPDFKPREDYYISIPQIKELIVNAPEDKYIPHVLGFIKNTLEPLFAESKAKTTELRTQTMSSLQIAELTGKRHNDVMRDIKNMLEQLNIQSAQFCADYKDSRGRTYPCYNLDEELTLTLTSGYSIPQRNAIIKEWQAYRQGNAPIQPATKLENQPALPAPHIVNASAIRIAISTIDKLPIGEERKAILKAQLLSREFGLNEGLMLPDTPHMLSATEIANKIGITANAIGRIVNELGIRENQELCRPRLGVAPNNNKQVEQYFYMPQVVDMIRKHLKQKGNKNGKAQQTNLL